MPNDKLFKKNYYLCGRKNGQATTSEEVLGIARTSKKIGTVTRRYGVVNGY